MNKLLLYIFILCVAFNTKARHSDLPMNINLRWIQHAETPLILN